MSTQIQKPLNPPSLQIDDVAEDSARQRFANYMRLQKRNARGDFKKRRLPTLALENLVTPCNSSPLPVLF